MAPVFIPVRQMAEPRDILQPQGAEHEPSLLDILDHVLNAGVVLHGSVVISIAGVDLVYVGINAVLTSVETALRTLDSGSDLQQRRKRH